MSKRNRISKIMMMMMMMTMMTMIFQGTCQVMKELRGVTGRLEHVHKDRDEDLDCRLPKLGIAEQGMCNDMSLC